MDKAVKAARDFAVARHGAQLYGKRPYVAHLDHVAGLCGVYGLPQKFIVAAYLHDTIEDTSVTKDELATHFGQEIADMVDCVTGEGNSRDECCASILSKLERNPDYINLKLMDRLANTSASVEEGLDYLVAMYRKELPKYAPLFVRGSALAYETLCRLLAK